MRHAIIIAAILLVILGMYYYYWVMVVWGVMRSRAFSNDLRFFDCDLCCCGMFCVLIAVGGSAERTNASAKAKGKPESAVQKPKVQATAAKPKADQKKPKNTDPLKPTKPKTGAALGQAPVIDPTASTSPPSSDELMADPCLSKPCGNDGQCLNLSASTTTTTVGGTAIESRGGGAATQTTYYCDCYGEWGGPICKTQLTKKESKCVDADYCHNGGTCVNSYDETAKPKQTSKCACKNGFLGAQCETKLSDEDDEPTDPATTTSPSNTTDTTRPAPDASPAAAKAESSPAAGSSASAKTKKLADGKSSKFVGEGAWRQHNRAGLHV